MADNDRNLRFGSRLLHSGIPSRLTPPLDTEKAERLERFGEPMEHSYSRSTPDESVAALEEKVARLQGDDSEAIAFASGQACTSTLLRMVSSGGHILCGEQVYGTTRTLIEKFLTSYDFVDPKLDNLRKARKSNTGLLLVETPTNPMLHIVDLEQVETFSKESGVRWILDNTFATMFLLDGFRYGAHAVYYSASKFLSGHHDVIAGIIVTKDPEYAFDIREARRVLGCVMAPDVAYRVNVEMQTLELRMRRECDNAQAVAEYLAEHPQVEKVHYPGLPSHPGHDVALRQMEALDGSPNKYGGIVSFEVKGDYKAFAKYFLKNPVISLCESLGSNVGILAHPQTMSHKGLTEEQRLGLGITPSLFRLSVGIAHHHDILCSLEQGLYAARKE